MDRLLWAKVRSGSDREVCLVLKGRQGLFFGQDIPWTSDKARL